MMLHVCLGLVLPLAVLGLSTSDESCTTIYVSTEGNDSWSGSLAAPDKSRHDGPLATLAAARDKVRSVKARGLTRPVRVVVRQGTYYLLQTLVLRPEDSGTAAYPIRYEAAPGEQVVLSGGRPVTGWKPGPGKLIYAELPQAREGWRFRQLFVDGRREPCARFPNEPSSPSLTDGWLTAVTKERIPVLLAGVAARGDWVEYALTLPTAGRYHLWVDYALAGKPLTNQARVTIDDQPLTLASLPATGGWRNVAYARAATVDLQAGRHRLRWESLGRQIHLAAFTFSNDPNFTPTATNVAQADAAHCVVVNAVSREARIGGKSSLDGGFLEIPILEPLQALEKHSPRHQIRCPNGTIHAAWAKAPEAEVNIFAEWGWYNEIVRIASVDSQESTITITGKECTSSIWPGNRFFVSNVFEELDQPGEWYFDRQAGRLHYWPRQRPPEQSLVVAPVVDRLIELRADPAGSERVQHVSFRGFTLAHTDYTVDHVEPRTAEDGCMKFDGACDCEVANCRFVNIGGYAVWLHWDCRRNRIVGNTISEAGAGGVLLTSARVGWGGGILDSRPGADRHAPVENVIADNHIHHCGRIRKYVSGVHLDWRPPAMAAAPGNLVAHNLIHDMPRLGIFAFSHQGGNVIEYNHIHHVCLESDDAGGIHLNSAEDLGASITYVRNNLIHDVEGPRANYDGSFRRKFGFGIYLDGATSNCVISGNLVHHTSSGAVFLNGGKDIVVENNILVGDVLQQLWVENYRGWMSGNALRRNVIVSLQPETPVLKLTRFDCFVFSESDRNLFWQVGVPPAIKPIGAMAAWQSQGYDRHSLVADPGFADPSHDDYSLKRESPAWKLGLAVLDLRNVGPRRPAGP